MQPLTLRRRRTASAGAILGFLLVLAACGTAFAPADPPDSGTDALPGMDGGGDVALRMPDDSPALPDGGGAIGDAGADVDAAPSCTPPKLPNGQGCDAGIECCSNVCKQTHLCADDCKSVPQACAVGGADCCVGTYCSPNALGHCMTCRPTGTAAEVAAIGNIVIAGSCCTGHVDTSGLCSP